MKNIRYILFGIGLYGFIIMLVLFLIIWATDRDFLSLSEKFQHLFYFLCITSTLLLGFFKDDTSGLTRIDIIKILASKPKENILNLQMVNLQKVDLAYLDLSGADLTGANLKGANLEGANLEGANLIGANLRDADLTRANLRGADLRFTDLTRANLFRADLTGALRD